MIEIDEGRKGDWMQTFTGNKVYPLDLRPSEIDISDIAQALSMQCRFAGHTKFHYSIAQHSVYCAQLAEHKLEALLHDASEAYLVDLPRPVKQSLRIGLHASEYDIAEDLACKAIAIKFGLIYPWPKDIKVVDEIMLTHEHNQVMGVVHNCKWTTDVPVEKFLIEELEPWEARTLFLDTYVKLAGKKH